MKKFNLIRYDLDKVYFMSEYNNTVAYANTNISINGVSEQLQHLEKEKNHYFEKVSSIVKSERENELKKYQKYEQWVKNEKKCKRTEILFILVYIIRLLIFNHLPIGMRTSLLYTLFDLLLMLFVFLIGPLTFIVTKIIKLIYGICYKRYIEPISYKINDLGNSFSRTSMDYYKAIDNLYLLSLDPAHRELVILRRQQEEHNQNMLRFEKQRLQAEKERLNEQRRAREATERLLSIEQEREKRRNSW